jgi:hypothetical protein
MSDYQLPTKLGDNTPRIMDDWGGNHAGPGWPIPGYPGWEEGNGGMRRRFNVIGCILHCLS